jgi:hypothetical protein
VQAVNTKQLGDKLRGLGAVLEWKKPETK